MTTALNKSPEEMTLDELIDFSRDHKMTEAEMEEQDIIIAVAEARHSGDLTATKETVREAVRWGEAKNEPKYYR